MPVRALIAALAVVVAAALSACGGDDGSSAATAPTATPPEVRTVTAAEIGPAVADGDVLLVDVRERSEWRAGHAPDALHVPLDEVRARLDEIEAAADGRPVAFVCRTGVRSAEAAAIAVEGGLPDVRHVDGGMSAWQAAGLALEPRDGRIA